MTPTSSLASSLHRDRTITMHGTIEQSEKQPTIQIVNESAEESDQPRPKKTKSSKASKEVTKAKTIRQKKKKTAKNSVP